MIASLIGTVAEVEGSRVTLDVQGVGYEVFCTSSAVQELLSSQETRRLLIYTDVKEDSIRLFGFAERLEREVFRLLISISGIGARTALDILSATEARSLLKTIAIGEAPQLQKIKGVGKKTAERIIVELRDKVNALTDLRGDDMQASPQGTSGRLAPASLSTEDHAIEEAQEALCALGFRREEAQKALSALPRDEQVTSPQIWKDPAQLVKLALQYI